MPVFRFKRNISITKGTGAFLDMEVGVARGGAFNTGREEQARELSAARQRIEQQRRALAKKEREITRLKMNLSASRRLEDPSQVRTDLRSTTDIVYGTLPDFLIIGAQKGGTTFLYHLLTCHPSVNPALKKEVHFFDRHSSKGVEWYESHFPLGQSETGRTITGEASPYYLYHPHAARRAAQVVPGAKLIALLRNPVDRAYSDYMHKVREGRDPLPFEEALDMEESRLRGEVDKMLADEDYYSINHRRFSYLSRGIYVDQIKEWHAYFGRDQLLALKSENFFESPFDTLPLVCEFLGLSHRTFENGDLRDDSDNRHKGGYEQMSPETRQRLTDYFAPHNQRLYRYLGMDFGW